PLFDFFVINFYGYGIDIESNSYSNTISENNISLIDEDTLIVLGLHESYSGNTILNNTFFLQGILNIGMNFEYTSSDIIINNSVTTAYDANAGISLAYSCNATIWNNTLDAIGFPIFVSGQNSSHFDHTIDTSNTEKGSPIYYFFNQSSLILENLNDVGQIYATYSDNITLSNISLQKQGIVFYNINNSVIKNATINTPGSNSTTSQGIWLVDSHNNNISSVFVNTTNGEDIELSHSQNISFINASYFDEEIDSYSTLERYWHLDVFVNYCNGSAVDQSNVSGQDKNNAFVFSEFTNSNGVIFRQTILEYSQNGSSKTYFTPFTINATKPNADKNDSIELNLTQNTILYFTLNSLPQIFISYDYTDDSFIEFDFFVNETYANDSFCALDIKKEGLAERTDTLMLADFSTTDNGEYSLIDKKYEDFYNGNYTINATCYDITGQSNYSYMNFSINDTTEPDFFIDSGISTTSAGFGLWCEEKIKCTLKLNNEVYSNTVFSKNPSFGASGLSAGSEYDYNFTCLDINNNSRQEIDTFTTSSVSNDDDDDNGGTGSPITGAPQGIMNDFASVMHSWDKVEFGKETQFSVSSTRIAIKKIIFYLKKTKTGVTLVVKSIGKPTEAKDIDEKKYDVKQYMQITATNLEKEDIKNITLEIKL
ncbi:MAG: hypothetical protein KAQ92_05415, partial [Candidatus Aenigmarchaeota archaeon]|nr:hypothetical protein [Candidatus Aenigmarchaeota archaeon]